jgi:hypothetical protein
MRFWPAILVLTKYLISRPIKDVSYGNYRTLSAISVKPACRAICLTIRTMIIGLVIPFPLIVISIRPVLRIHEILVRFRIRGFIPVTNESGSCSFVSDRQDINKKLFCFLLFKGTFTSFFKDKTSSRSHKTVGINVFSYF